MDPPYFQPYGAGQPNEPISPYQYSPGAAPTGFMGHQPPRHPSHPVPSCGPPYTTAQYAQAPGPHHLPMPQMDLAPMGARAPQYTVQPSSGPGITPPGGLSYHTQRHDPSAGSRRATVPGTLAGHNDQRVPRTQTSIGSGEMTAMFRGNSNSGGNYGGSPTGEPAASSNGKASIASTIPGELLNLCVTDGEQIVLNDRAPEEDRMLFDIHAQQLGARGKGMWDNITSQYYKVLGEKAPSTPRLQMKYVRSLRKHFMLPEESFRRLLAIYEEDERDRYNRIWKIFRDTGVVGSDVKVAEIECYLVRLGLENPTQDEATKVRRRRRSAAAKREQRSAPIQDRHQSPPGMVWNNSYGHMSVDGHHQYPLPGTAPQQNPGQGAPGFDFPSAMPTALSATQEDNLMMEIEMKYNGGSPEMASHGCPSPSTPGSASHDSHNPMLASGADLNAHARTLPSPSAMMPSMSSYGSMARAPDVGSHIKHEAWR